LAALGLTSVEVSGRFAVTDMLLFDFVSLGFGKESFLQHGSAALQFERFFD
jgi:hypothetical protein